MTTTETPPVTQILADVCRAITFDDLPAEAVTVAKQCVLDWLGVTIAGAGEPLALILRDQICGEGGDPQATLIGDGLRVTCSQAALVNGATAHALDYDDVAIAMGHPTVPILSALLALAEQREASGRALLAALVAGHEMEGRVAAMVMPGHYSLGFHSTGTVGAFGAAAACCHLMGLAPEQWRNALGVAGAQAAGLKSMFGTMTKPLQAGKAAANGLFAAAVAARGFTSNPDVFETAQGFAATQAPAPDFEAAIAGAGHLAIMDTLFKYHAACYGTHATIEGVLRLRAENDLRPGAVDSIQLSVPMGNLTMCNIQQPVTGLEGKFSMRFAAAAALCEGAAHEGIFTNARVGDPRLIAMRDRVTVEGSATDQRGTTVTMLLTDGRQLQQRVDLTVPEPDVDLQWRRLSSKFLGLATPVIGGEAAQQLLGMTRELDDVRSMRAVARVAVPLALAEAQAAARA